jgi:ABC-type branched-subunit amino acid transport system ATPase component/ABC-type branched-subunit amino acid transport system permease subunit
VKSAHRAPPASEARTLRERVERRHLVGIALALVGLGFAPFVLLPYPLALLTLALAYGLFAFGLDLCWGRAGVVSIGHAAFFGLGAYGSAVAAARQLPMVLGALVGVGAAVLLALLVGAAGLGRRALPATMAVLTLALTLIMSQLALSWTPVTNGSNGLFVHSSGVVAGYYRTAAVVAVVVAVVWLLVLRGPLGRRFVAIRVNEQRAAHLGIDPRRTKIAALVLSGGVAAVAGAVAAPSIGLVTPSTAGILLSTEVLVWVAVGGVRTIGGAFLGAGLVTIGEQTLGGVLGSWYLLLMGLLFLLVVRFAPEGLVGIARSLARRPLAERSASGALLATGSGRAAARAGPLPANEPAVRARDVEKGFGSVPVIRGVCLDVPRAEVLCLIGPNGAGKTTLLGVLDGEHLPERGAVTIGGHPVTQWPPHQRARLGLGRMFQVPSVFLDLTPAQNMAIALAEGAGAPVVLPRYERFGRDDGRLARELSLADRRALELAMVLAWGPAILLLDEPAAGLSHQDSIELARGLRQAAEHAGCTLVAVEHDMEIVRELADRVVVLADGRVLVAGTMDQVAAHDEVRRAYLGVTCSRSTP